jgi:uncharacterized protein YcfJ
MGSPKGPNDERRRTTMKKMVTLSIAALMSTATLGMAAPAAAQNSYYDQRGYSSYNVGYDRDDRRYDRRYDRRADRRDYRQDRRYNQQRYINRNYRQCDNGTGGTIIGAIAGGLAGHEIAGRGDRAVGTIIGGAVGAIAGRAIDKGNDGCR